MKVLITGATGFVGKVLVRNLLNNGMSDLCLLVRNQEKAEELFKGHSLSCINNSIPGWQKFVIDYNPDVILHLATLFDNRHNGNIAEQLISTNVLFTTLLLEAVSHTDCRYFINVGTFSEFQYGNENYCPNNLYSASKSAVRPIIRFFQSQNRWNWINIIIYSPYGRINEHKKVIDHMADALNSPIPVKFSGGEQILDFIHVDDIADFFYCLLMKLHQLKEEYIQFHLGTGNGYSLREIVTMMEKVSGQKVNALWGAYPYSPADIMYAVAPIGLNIKHLQWTSKIDIETGIAIFLNENS